jgi:cytoskeleton protein RodZ
VEANGRNLEGHESSPGTGIGGRLVKAREAQGLTLAVVANKLRLSAATLQAIESNRYEDLPEPIFVRGYLRAYTRLLGMDTEAFVAEYDRVAGSPGPVLMPTPKVRRQATPRSPYILGTAALIVVVMVVLFGSWWYSRQKHDVPAQFHIGSSEAEQTTSAAPVLPPSQIDSPKPGGPGPTLALSPDIPPQSLASGAADERVAAVESEPQPGKTLDAAEPALPRVGESPVTTNADAAVQQRDVETTVEPAVSDLPIAPLASEHGRIVRASRAPMGEDVLVIKANDESWAEVVDANGYQLLYFLLRPGMVHRLQGQAPFRVFLGNAPAVDLSLNQKRFDHTPFRHRNSTARFSVDDAP